MCYGQKIVLLFFKHIFIYLISRIERGIINLIGRVDFVVQSKVVHSVLHGDWFE